MKYFTERNGMRQPINRTYTIDPYSYGFLLRRCEKYYENIAWKYPKVCPDGGVCYGIDESNLVEDMYFEIPNLFIDDSGRIGVPQVVENIFNDEPYIEEYDQYALLDFIEFLHEHMKDVQKGDYHSFYKHYHLITKETADIREQFRDDINALFTKTGLLYEIKSSGYIERIVLNDIASADVIDQVLAVREKGVHDLLQESLELHRSHAPNASRDSVEKLWDAFERLKTYHTKMDKKDSANLIIDTIADKNEKFAELLQNEFKMLTIIGNEYRIRHHETDKIEIKDDRHYDYFFGRCLSIIALAISYLNQENTDDY